MASKVSSMSRRVNIKVTGGSFVKNVRIQGRRVDKLGFWDRPEGRATVYFSLLMFCVACWASVIFLAMRFFG